MITAEMTIDEIFETHPQKAEQLAYAMSSKGLQCVGCSASTWETLERGMKGHGMSDEDVAEMVVRLNDILSEEAPPADTVAMTERAAKKYRSTLEAEGKGDWGVRFAEKKGGCSGFEYVLDYSEKAREDDKVYLSQGIEIHVPNGALERLLGSEIDYIDGLQGAGFKISNPNVRKSCGCGNSHSY